MAGNGSSTGLRINDPALTSSAAASFIFNGATCTGLEGESIAAALMAAGIATFGHRKDGAPRGLWCGVGVCQECLVNVDGKPSVRACMTTLNAGMTVTTQGYLASMPAHREQASTVAPQIRRPQVLVVGAGPAGLSAARAAALCGATVTIIDERAMPGGQYFKQPAKSHAITDLARTDAQVRRGHDLIAEVQELGVNILRSATLWGAFSPREMGVLVEHDAEIFAPEALILAMGAYERGVPVPGWTLPGYMTTGAAQTLVRAYQIAPGRRVLIGGNGPLNLQLAAELVAAGVEVVALVEAAAKPGLRHLSSLLSAAWASSALIGDGLRYLARLRRAGVPTIYSSAVVSARGTDRVQGCTVAKIDARGHPVAGSSIDYAVDTVCLGHGFLPSNEIARAIGCRHAPHGDLRVLATEVDEVGLTSVPGVYAIGDMAILRGAQVAQHQGTITGCAAAQALGLKVTAIMQSERGHSVRMLQRHRRFQRALWQLFDAPLLTHQLATAETIICRCENVAASAIDSAIRGGAMTLGTIKRRTRACMGRCQGRYCETLVASLLPDASSPQRDERFNLAPRAPSKPTRVGDVA